VTVVARDDGHVRLRVPRGTEPATVLQAVGWDVVRVSYEPSTLSDLFRLQSPGRGSQPSRRCLMQEHDGLRHIWTCAVITDHEPLSDAPLAVAGRGTAALHAGDPTP